MPILLLLFGFFFPRLVIAYLYIFTGWFSDGFNGVLLPILGFLFMPITLLWYGLTQYYFAGEWTTVATIGIVLAVLLDLGLIGRGAKRKRA